MLTSIVIGIITAGIAAVAMTRRSRAGHLSDSQRRELADRCIALGIPRDEIEALVSSANDHALIERHRAEHRRLKAQNGPFR